MERSVAAEERTIDAGVAQDQALLRAGGISAPALGAAYLVITVPYLPIVTAVLTLVWVLLVRWRLMRLRAR